MKEEINEIKRDFSHYDMMDLFEDISFREKFRKVITGLKQPKDTGEYKYAKLQLLRLLAPISAVVVPIIAVALLALFAGMTRPPVRMVNVMILEPEAIEELDEIEEIIEDIPEMEIEVDFTPDVAMPQEISIPAPDTDFSPKPAEFDSVAIVKSPVIMKGIYGSRSPGARGQAMREYGGSSATEGAVLRALRWLKKEQGLDGSWRSPAPAMTGFGLLTFLAHGETPSSEEFGPTVEKAIKWLVSNQREDGRFKGMDGNQYSHPIATYALCEAYALTKVPMLKSVAEKALDVIIKGQHESGGWDYQCRQSTRDDTSYMGWCAQALKAADMAEMENEGLKAAMRKAIKGFQKNAHPKGGFGYTGPGQGGLTGVGVLCMQLLGAAKEPEARNGLVYLDQVTFQWDTPWGGRPIYYWYYITQAKFHAGGEVWNTWNNKFAMELVKNQTVLKGVGIDDKDIGYWVPATGKSEYNKVMDTTLCALMLQVYYRYLPTFKPPEEIKLEEEVASEEDVDIDINM